MLTSLLLALEASVIKTGITNKKSKEPSNNLAGMYVVRDGDEMTKVDFYQNFFRSTSLYRSYYC